MSKDIGACAIVIVWRGSVRSEPRYLTSFLSKFLFELGYGLSV